MSELRKPYPSVRFELKGVPPSFSNLRLHWAKLSRLKDEWFGKAWYMGQSARILAGWIVADARFGDRRLVKITLHRQRLLDPDNLVSSIKPVLDGLKKNLIVDYSPQWCELAVDQVKVKTRLEERVEVVVEPVSAEAKG